MLERLRVRRDVAEHQLKQLRLDLSRGAASGLDLPELSSRLQFIRDEVDAREEVAEIGADRPERRPAAIDKERNPMSTSVRAGVRPRVVACRGAPVPAPPAPAQRRGAVRSGRAPAAAAPRPRPPTAEIMETFSKASTGNVADAVDEATGRARVHGPRHEARVQGQGDRARGRPCCCGKALRNDKRDWPNLQIQTLDDAPPGSVMVEVLEDGLDIAGIGNLMATTAKVRGLAGMVIDGGARDVEELEEIGFPVWSRSQTPATSVGRYVPVARNVPVMCGGSSSGRADWIVADRDRRRRRARGVAAPGAEAPAPVRRQGDEDGAAHQGDEVDGQGAGEVQSLLTAPTMTRCPARR